jgi:hypothetical protein
VDWGLVKREEGGREGMGVVKEKVQGKEGRGEEMEERNIEVKTLNSTFAPNMTLIITTYKTRFCQVYGPGTVTSILTTTVCEGPSRPYVPTYRYGNIMVHGGPTGVCNYSSLANQAEGIIPCQLIWTIKRTVFQILLKFHNFVVRFI